MKIIMSKKERDEIAVTAVAEKKDAAVEEDKIPKQNIFQKVSGFMNTAQEVASSVNEFYQNWVKPIYDNRAQISRRLNGISTAVSIVFFVLYVPLLLFSNIAKGLSFGWEIALYCCIGIYAVMLTILLIVTVASGRSASVDAARRRKRASKIVLIIVRIASVAIAITALVITETAERQDNANLVLDTVGVVFSIVSIIFSLLPLIFGGVSGVFKWLISPAKIKRTFSFVALEWYELVTTSGAAKSGRKVNKRYYEAIGKCLDSYILPPLGNKYAKSVTGTNVSSAIAAAPEEERGLVEAILQNIFVYSVDCGYVSHNPCTELGFTDNIEEVMKNNRGTKKKNFFSLFRREK